MSVYERLGVHPAINAWGTVTTAGGSRMDPRVLASMTEASRSFVDMEELLRAAERRIAELIGAEAVCVTSGAAAGMALCAAACMAGSDRASVLALPETRGLRDEVLILKAHRILYDQAVLLAGARFREIGVTSSVEPEQIRAAVGERTAMLLYVAEARAQRGSLPLETVAAALEGTTVPLVVDAAAELPPRTNLSALLDAGADLVVFSGGKEIRGPQSSGFVAGRHDLIDACRANAFPRYGIGRPMKLDKETVVGLVTAVELFMARDLAAEYRNWERAAACIAAAIADSGRATARVGLPIGPGVQPADIPRAYVRHAVVPASDLRERLRRGEPRVFADVSGDELVLNPQCLDPEEIPQVIAAVLRAFATDSPAGSPGRGEA